MKRLVLFVFGLFTLSHGLDGARYLIIAADELASAIQPLANWRHAAGLSTKVVKLSGIGYDTLAIKNYIRNAYNNWTVRPEFVLLVGSPEMLPARY